MKYFIGVVVVLVLIFGGYWAGKEQGEANDEDVTPTPIAEVIIEEHQAAQPSSQVAWNGMVGNQRGNKAPDFRLKDSAGNEFSLRDYQGREAVQLVFTVSGQVTLQGRTLLDPDNTVHRLYGVTSMPYTVNIDVNGVIY